MARKKPEPPEWWNKGLYDFLEDLPLEGWVWEFMRRARLKTILGAKPVDAMNPKPKHSNLHDEMSDYLYMPWPKVISEFRWWGKKPLYFAPAVWLRKRWPAGFHGQPVQLPPMSMQAKPINIVVDVNRRDSVIKREFDVLLEKIRIKVPEPKEIKPRVGNWSSGEPLITWDLRQYSVTFKAIAGYLGFRAPDGAIIGHDYEAKQARNYYREASQYIDEGMWEDLARYIEVL